MKLRTTLSIIAALSLSLSLSGTALAQDPQVNAANPSTAPQGTVALDVDIDGANFDNSADVKFLVSGSKKTGGVTVNTVTFVNPNRLRANISVAADATVSNFDIEVRQARGRTGKGTELFAVLFNENQGRGENAQGIATYLTQNFSTMVGVFSDQWDPDAGIGNPRYVDLFLDGVADPDGPGSLIADCAIVPVPVENGVDRSMAQIFIPAPHDCPPARFQLVRGAGYDLDRDGTVELDEHVYHKIRCENTFPKGTATGESWTSSCWMLVWQLLGSNGDRDEQFRFDWSVTIVHDSDDVRTVYATDADIYEHEAPEKGNGKKAKVFRERKYMPMVIRFHRVRH